MQRNCTLKNILGLIIYLNKWTIIYSNIYIYNFFYIFYNIINNLYLYFLLFIFL